MDNKIDFVITWVDDSDPKWREAYEYHSAKEGRTINADACRYRDWDTLRYWFRGVEKFAPWVNKIFFVTYGHLPKWLNTDNSKLVIVKHEDFIPAQYLPTFSSNVIELYFHKIKGLSDKFVYFNDDMFLIDDVSPDRFFKKGLPCDMGALEIWRPDRIVFSDMVLMSIGIINTHFDKKAVLNKNIFKWYNKAYIKVSLRNFLYQRLDFFPGFFNHHLPQGYLKHIYDEIWSNCEEDLTRTSYNKFRAYGDVAPWLIRYWQLASGNFSPCNVNNDGKAFYLCDDIISECVDCISHQKKKIICLNDGEHVTHFEDNKQQLLRAFEQILPEKSSFECLPLTCPSGRCLISIIVPVYRVEAYLRKCLDSIVCQTYQNLEIILVDDGSPDSCGEICDAYAARDERIRVIHQQNAGIGSARNAGLDISRGDFIMFVDSDDWIDQNTCETVLSVAQQQKADIVCYGYNEINTSGSVLPYKEEAGEMEKKEVISRLVRGIPTISDVCWNKFVSKRILEDLRFPEGRLHEDLGFTYKMIHLAEKIYVTDAVLYHYYVKHEGSVTYTFYKLNQIEDRVFFLKERLAFLEMYYPEFVDRQIMVIIGELMTGLDRVEGEQNKKIIHKELVEFVRTHKRRIRPFRHESKSIWLCYYCPEMVKLLLGLRRSPELIASKYCSLFADLLHR